MLNASTFKFLKDLKKYNNKAWFDQHRKEYEAAKQDHLALVQEVIDLHGKKDPSIKLLTAKECVFRINRDVRFSKDKSPYKVNFGASINKGGKKAWNAAGYYFHIEPGKSFAGGGLYMPEAPVLKMVRQEIDYNLEAFEKIIKNKKFKSLYGDLDRSSEMSLTRVPKGYEPDNPAASQLKLKGFIAMVNIPDEVLKSKAAAKTIATAFDVLSPLIQFLNQATT
ncbi:MAG: DUF2461 domain-containing protein [Chitinophagaceae bacterium]|nr:DUF2461 domain-containing protein [Chitinophagaceae bacterium]